MSDDFVVNDDIDIPADDGTATAVADGEGQDNYGELQDRMAGDDDPWFSSSEGKVVTKDGEIITDPTTGKPFTKWEDFVKFQEGQQKSQPTAKPKTNEQAQVKPFSKPFENFVFGDDGLTPEKLYELGKSGSDYTYNDDLIPKIDPNAAQSQEQSAPVDPVERVKAERQNIETVAVQPIREIRDALIAQGADPVLAEQLLAPILQKQQALVETHYQQAYEKALEERLDSKYGSKLSKIDEDKLTAASNGNVETLARKYYPEGGKEALFTLINGHYDEQGNFTRGPSAQVIDLLVSVANDGKQFKTQEERNGAYANTFKRLTADPVKAKALVDIAHYYWLGKKSHEAQKLTFEKGKQSAQQQQQRVQRTIKTKPASFAAPNMANDDEGMPSMLRAALRQ